MTAHKPMSWAASPSRRLVLLHWGHLLVGCQRHIQSWSQSCCLLRQNYTPWRTT